MDRATVNTILGRKPDLVPLDEWIVAELSAIEAVRSGMVALARRREEARREFESAIEQIDREVRAIREACPHYRVHHHPDPAGGSDSFRSCELCGKAWA